MAIAAAVSAGPVSAAGAQATQVTQHYSARAVDLESGELLYSEHHTESLHNGEISTSRVVYVDRAGDTLATKTMQFAAAPTRPAFFIEYHIEGTAEGVYTVGDSLVLERRRGLSTESETKTVAINEPVVIDGGFDHAVRQHWDRLGAGKSFAFDFPLPDRLASYRFRVRMTDETMHHGQPARRFRIEPASFFVRLVAPSIELIYDRGSRRLLRYEGIGNVTDPDTGRRYRARIDFDYPGDAKPLVLYDETSSIAPF